MKVVEFWGNNIRAKSILQCKFAEESQNSEKVAEIISNNFDNFGLFCIHWLFITKSRDRAAHIIVFKNTILEVESQFFWLLAKEPGFSAANLLCKIELDWHLAQIILPK